jgi:hypothetical protein
MHTNSDDLSDLERRLAGCEPSPVGLDADAMLYAAGRASVPQSGPARFVWPTVSAGLAVLAAILGVCLVAERSERFALAQRGQDALATPAQFGQAAQDELPAKENWAPSSVLAARRALEQGLDAWPPVTETQPPGPPLPDEPILRVGKLSSLLEL